MKHLICATPYQFNRILWLEIGKENKEMHAFIFVVVIFKRNNKSLSIVKKAF